MFIGSFYRVKSNTDLGRQFPIGSGSAIIYVEDENKFYEKTAYGLMKEYEIGRFPEPKDVCSNVDYTAEITDMEKRIHDLEVGFNNLGNIIGGKINEI